MVNLINKKNLSTHINKSQRQALAVWEQVFGATVEVRWILGLSAQITKMVFYGLGAILSTSNIGQWYNWQFLTCTAYLWIHSYMAYCDYYHTWRIQKHTKWNITTQTMELLYRALLNVSLQVFITSFRLRLSSVVLGSCNASALRLTLVLLVRRHHSTKMHEESLSGMQK